MCCSVQCVMTSESYVPRTGCAKNCLNLYVKIRHSVFVLLCNSVTVAFVNMIVFNKMKNVIFRKRAVCGTTLKLGN